MTLTRSAGILAFYGNLRHFGIFAKKWDRKSDPIFPIFRLFPTFRFHSSMPHPSLMVFFYCQNNQTCPRSSVCLLAKCKNQKRCRSAKGFCKASLFRSETNSIICQVCLTGTLLSARLRNIFKTHQFLKEAKRKGENRGRSENLENILKIYVGEKRRRKTVREEIRNRSCDRKYSQVYHNFPSSRLLPASFFCHLCIISHFSDIYQIPILWPFYPSSCFPSVNHKWPPYSQNRCWLAFHIKKTLSKYAKFTDL